MAANGIRDPAVAAAFAAFAPPLGDLLRAVRRLILDTAATTDGVGRLVETVKWGQPAYLTAAPKSGSTIRLGEAPGLPGQGALFVHCQTSLVEAFRRHYPDRFAYQGSRAVVLPAEGPLPSAELAHMIALALTYHRWKDRVA
ncbi:MAG: DUF1801 domain-containing protein [Azospirillaceae bacterium]